MGGAGGTTNGMMLMGEAEGEGLRPRLVVNVEHSWLWEVRATPLATTPAPVSNAELGGRARRGLTICCRDRHLLPLYNTPIDLLTDSLYADAGLLIQVHQHDWAIPAGEWKDGRVRSPRTAREQNIRDVMTVMQVRENRVTLRDASTV